ncbi:hypothetical protein HPP92_020045 [Vanilla planifolia]|uniref:MAR-binding filament-like protein 1-1 n=1 Tax=Vanilla planifolia TaxID=51239 RepID=A0A835ULP5_VANPL|nr:hypothetical protein HPP92_020045 [Vanilla planifolia]
MVSSLFMQSALCQILPSTSCCSPLLLPSHRKVARKKRASVVDALANGGRTAEESGPFQRRVFLLLGFSFLPFLPLREASAKKRMAARSHSNCKQNAFSAFPFGIGIIVSGVVATLFAASQKEKKALESTIDSMKAQLSDKDTEAAFLRESFGTRLLQQQEEQDEQLRRLNEEEVSLSRQLTSTKDALAALDQQLQVERRLVEELKARRDQLEHSMRKAREEEKILEADCNEKEDRINAGAKLAAANSTIEQLKDTIFDARKELDTKSSVINDLHSKVKSLTEEKDVSNSKLYNLVKEYNDLISSTEKRDAFNSELLSKKDEQLHRLKEDLKLALSEIKSKQTMISELAKERDDVIASMEEEHNYTREAKNELQTNQELLATAMTERSEMSKELEEARTAYKEALTKISKMQDEYEQTRLLLNSDLEEAQATSKVLSDELESAKEIIRLTENELNSASDELKAVIEERESSRKEFEDAYKLVETMSIDLKKESKRVGNLSEELEVLRKQVMQDLEARKTLEVDLDNATRSLDEMNESNMLLSKELDYITSSSASLEAEKEMLYKSLAEQKYIAKEAQENIEDAHNLITRLGSEKENLERRFNRLVEELAAAKGEILRLRRLISAGQESVNFHDTQAGTPLSTKRNGGRRKKRAPSSDVS